MTELRNVAPTEVPEGAHLIDVREQSEWDAGHAPTARHLAASSLLEKLDELPEDGDLYIVCRSGGRSFQVSQWLNANGYDAINVAGGMDQWFESGLPMVSDGEAEPFVL
ncbi:rhodanese-like domain-containing protein [Brachybacterium sp. J144]|uniref:rhodanese-like domain-containing protein n=1 Tax=Brachybacterium sp. J144 TaxID=3116487 RepID=UPI002E7A7A32|nr:rhodanese-like domain-containing protein [Brachybacterium sp. J144]MEE1650914.1 rhodanese-like domain-containing protein [Brachybacterium sp. J144]